MVIGIVTINESLGAPTPPNKDELKDGVYVDTRDIPPGTEKTKKRKKFVAPLTYFEDGAKYNDAEVIRKCTKPKLIFMSEDDEFFSPDDIKKIFDSMPELKEFHKLRGNHDYRYYPDVIKEVNKVLGEFIDKYIDKK